MNPLFSFMLCLCLVFPLTTHGSDTSRENEYDLQAFRDAVDFVIAAIGTHNPDPVMSTVLSAVPESTRGLLFINSDAKMVAITLAIDENPEQEAELMDLINRYQAIMSAASGDNTRLKQILAKERQASGQTGPHATPPAPAPDAIEAEERDSLKLQLDKLQQRILALQEEKSQLPNFRQLELKMDEAFSKARGKPALYDGYESRVRTFYKMAETFLTDASRLQEKIHQSFKTAQDKEALITQLIQAAKVRAAHCQGPEDSALVAAAYQEAKNAFANLNKQLEVLPDLLLESGEQIHRIDKVNALIEQTYESLHQEAPKQAFQSAFNTYSEASTDWQLGKSKINHLNLEAENLNADLYLLKRYYLKTYPDTSSLFSEYESRIGELRIDTRYLDKRSIQQENQLKTLRNHHDKLYKQSNSYLISGPFEPVEYVPLKDLATLLEKAENLHLAALMLIDTNDALQDGCDAQDAPDSTERLEDDTPSTDPDGENPPEGISLLDENTNDPGQDDGTEDSTTPSPTTDEEILIRGPASILVGETAEFLAVNRQGLPYPDPSVLEWTKTRPPLMTVPNGGNPCLAEGVKAGLNRIIVIHEGIQKSAMHDVTILARVPNLSGMNGKEAYQLVQSLNLQPSSNLPIKELMDTQVTGQSPEAGFIASEGQAVQISVSPAQEWEDENLFATDGGEQVDVSGQDMEQGPLVDEPTEAFPEADICESYRDQVAKALRQRNTDEAMRQAGIAAASGCDLNFGAIAAIIEEIENEKQLALEYSLHQQESERVTRAHEAWMEQYQEEQQRFREQMEQRIRSEREALEQDRQHWTEEDRAWQKNQDLMHQMIHFWYAQTHNSSGRDRDENDGDSYNRNNRDTGTNHSTSQSLQPAQNQSYEVSYWENGNMKEERLFFDTGKLKTLRIYEKSTGYFINEKQYHPNGHLKYSLTHWHNGRHDLGIAREEFYDPNGQLIRKVGYNRDGSVRETWDK